MSIFLIKNAGDQECFRIFWIMEFYTYITRHLGDVERQNSFMSHIHFALVA